MKKMVVLTLVLGIVPIVSAGLYFTIEGNVAVINSDSTQPWPAYVVWTDSLDAVGELTELGALSLSVNEDLGVNDMADFGFPQLGLAQVMDVGVAGSVGETIIPGAHYTVSVSLPEGLMLGDTDMGLGRIDILQYELDGIIDTVFVTTAIPEPASMLLLGLGGLLLRRK